MIRETCGKTCLWQVSVFLSFVRVPGGFCVARAKPKAQNSVVRRIAPDPIFFPFYWLQFARAIERDMYSRRDLLSSLLRYCRHSDLSGFYSSDSTVFPSGRLSLAEVSFTDPLISCPSHKTMWLVDRTVYLPLMRAFFR